MKGSQQTFWVSTVAASLIISAIVYAPVFTGKIPFPADFVFNFPPFAPVRPADLPVGQTNIGDLVTSFYPYHTVAARAAREGTLPLWNPYMLSGTPFLANTQAALFYPLNFLYYALPVSGAWTIGFFLRRVLAATFTALLLRRLGGTTTGAVGAGLIFAFCGFLTAWQGQAMSDAAIWLPLICYSVLRLHDEPQARSAVIAAFAFAMPVLAGHPETAAHSTLTGVAFAAFLWIRQPRFSFVKTFVICGALSLGLAAVQLLPTVEWLKHIHNLRKDPWPAQPLWSIVTFVSRDIIREESAIGLQVPEQTAYLAMMSFAVAPLALLKKSSRGIALFFAACTAAALSVVYAVGPAYWVVRFVPVLSLVRNSRLVFVASFAFAVLAGLGISTVEEWRARLPARQAQRAISLSLVGCAVAFSLLYVIHRLPARDVIGSLRTPRFAVFLLLMGLLLVSLKSAGYLSHAWFRSLTLILIALDLTTVTYGAIPFARPRDVFPRIELFDRLPKPSTQPFRIAQVGYAYGANFELMYDHKAVGGYEIPLERFKQFLNDLSQKGIDGVILTSQAILEAKDRRVDMLNTKYIIVSEWDSRWKDFRDQPNRLRFLYKYGDTDVYENLKVLPPAYCVPVSGVEVIPDEARQLERVKDPLFNVERTVILSSSAPESIPAGPPPPAITKPKTEWTTRHMNDFELDVNAYVPSVLIISQIDYPGWKAFVDGNPVPLTRANYAFPAIFISSGPHHVRFSFEPWTFKVGLAATVITLIISGVMIRSGVTREAEDRI
jgi:hypothetical protein